MNESVSLALVSKGDCVKLHNKIYNAFLGTSYREDISCRLVNVCLSLALAVRFMKKVSLATWCPRTPVSLHTAAMTSLLRKPSVKNRGAWRGPQSKHIMHDATQYVGNNAPADKLKAIKL